MRKLITLFSVVFFLSVSYGQDITITIKPELGYPQISMGINNKKYFVMTTDQDKVALARLQQGLYAESLILAFDKMIETLNNEKIELSGKNDIKSRIILSQAATIDFMSSNYNDLLSIKDNETSSKKLALKQLKKQRFPILVSGIVIGSLGTTLLIQALK